MAFRQRSLAAWEPYAESVVNGYLDQVVERGSAELVRELTFPYPIQVIAKILGVPPEDTGKFHEWAWWIINVAADPDKGIAASEAMKAYLRRGHRRPPGRSGRRRDQRPRAGRARR